MSDHVRCDACGRECTDRHATFSTGDGAYAWGQPRRFDLCASQDSDDVGCASQLRAALAFMADRAGREPRNDPRRGR